MPEHIENDLHRGHVVELNAFQGFLHFLDADAQVLYFPLLFHTVEQFEDFGAIIHFRRRAVQLYEIQRFKAHVFEAVFHKLPQRGGLVRLVGVRTQLPPAFRCDINPFRAALDKFPHHFLALAAAINIGGVDKVDAAIDGFVQDTFGQFVVEVGAPFSTYLPGAEADF